MGIVLSECSLDLGQGLYVMLKIIMEQILEQKIIQNVRKFCGKQELVEIILKEPSSRRNCEPVPLGRQYLS